MYYVEVVRASDLDPKGKPAIGYSIPLLEGYSCSNYDDAINKYNEAASSFTKDYVISLHDDDNMRDCTNGLLE